MCDFVCQRVFVTGCKAALKSELYFTVSQEEEQLSFYLLKRKFVVIQKKKKITNYK